MTHSVEMINLSRIYLHNENPRHDPINNESEIISYLIANEGVKQLARHIADAGNISPLERIGVVAHSKVNGAYVAAEGNRRICAIKLLADPDKADTEANRKYFRNLRSKMVNRLSTVEAVVFEDMKTARPWISLRHEGEQEGAGTKRWNAEQIARFSAQEGNGKNANIQSYLLMQYARRQRLLPAEKIGALSITTLTRFLSNRAFRAMLGLTDNKTLAITVSPQEFDRAVTRFLLDSLSAESGVNSRTRVGDREGYAEKLRSEGDAPTTRGLPPIDINAGTLTASVSVSSPKIVVKRNNRSPDDRKTVIPPGFVARITNPILKRLYDELRKLEAAEYSFAAIYLLRAVIEQIATLFLQQNGLSLEGKLHAKLGRVADALKKKGVDDNELKMLRMMASDTYSRYSPHMIGNFVHGGAVPTHTHAIKLWDSIEPVVKKYWLS